MVEHLHRVFQQPAKLHAVVDDNTGSVRRVFHSKTEADCLAGILDASEKVAATQSDMKVQKASGGTVEKK